VLEEIGCARAEIVIAVTGDDEDNLVICQVAKTRFHVPQTIARVNNPRNEALFRELGIDLIVSPTQSILHSIEVQIPHHTLVPLVSLTRAGLSLVELTVPSRSPAAGRTIRELELPSSANIVLIERGTEPLTPSGETELQEEDHLFALVTDDGERSLREHILTEAEAS
jgi:trk system potassium uptake protein TrkA